MYLPMGEYFLIFQQPVTIQLSHPQFTNNQYTELYTKYQPKYAA